MCRLRRVLRGLLTALAGLLFARTCLQYSTGAAHMTLVVKTPAATASASATIRAKSAFGPEALSPPAIPVVSMYQGCTIGLMSAKQIHMHEVTTVWFAST